MVKVGKSSSLALVSVFVLFFGCLCSTTVSATPPTPVLDGVDGGYVNETLEFDGSRSSDPDGTVVAYLFDWGDGSNTGWGSSPLVTHSYDQAGTYVVSLYVKDNSEEQSPEPAELTVQIVDELGFIVGEPAVSYSEGEDGMVDMEVTVPFSVDVGVSLVLSEVQSSSNTLWGRAYDVQIVDESQEVYSDTQHAGDLEVSVPAGDYDLLLMYDLDSGEVGRGEYTFTAQHPTEGTEVSYELVVDYDAGNIGGGSMVGFERYAIIGFIVLMVLILGLMSLRDNPQTPN